jgi:phosphinothricin acetyltransferase
VDWITTRTARLFDLDAITEIYNEAIRTTTATFDTEPKTKEEQLRWFQGHGSRYPILVAELDGRVVGWGCLSQWSDRGAYRETAETSCYVKQEHRNQGIGRRLMESIVEEGRRLGFHTLLARVAEGGEASLHLSKSLGFEHVGVLKEVGRKFGKRLDVHILQKIYPSESDDS